MTKCAIYARISTPDQHLETQLYPLRELATRRGFEVVQEFTDTVSGSKARRPSLDALLADAHRHKFSVILVAAFDRVARSVKHFLSIVDELADLGIELISSRENFDTSGAMGRLFVTIIGSMAELERSLIVERIKAGMRRRKMDGLRCGRAPLDLDHEALAHDRLGGMSLTQVSKKYGCSRASVVRFTKQATKLESAQVSEFQPAAVLEPAECVA